jgi:hypothetical protein
VPDVLASRSYSQQQLQGSGKRGLISIAQRVISERKAGKGRQCKQCKRKEQLTCKSLFMLHCTASKAAEQPMLFGLLLQLLLMVLWTVGTGCC